MCLVLALKAIAVGFLVHSGIRLAFWLYLMFIRKQNWSRYQKRNAATGQCESWAVVTGATDGIGLGFVKALAEAGWNVLLLSRSHDKLVQVSASLAATYPQCQFEHFAWDVGADPNSAASRERMQKLLTVLNGRDVGLLVNNVGVTESVFGWFGDQAEMWPEGSEGLCAEMFDAQRTVQVNCTFPTRITHAILPLLLNRASASNSIALRSGIVNLSSILGILPSPFSPIYGASKAFNRVFSRSLSAEYYQKGVDVLCVSPGMVASRLTGFTRGNMVCSEARPMATIALNALGAAVEVLPHPIHGITMLPTMAIGLLPAWLQTLFYAIIMRLLPKPPGIRVTSQWL